MTRRLPKALPLIVLLALLIPGCGAKNDLNVSEGEQVRLGSLTYNVQLSRFLNPGDAEDRYYLSGKAKLPSSKSWFGVFVQIKNSSDSAQPIPRDFVVQDTLGNRFSPQRSTSVFALDLGGQIAPHASAPTPDTPAANGPTQGSLILFSLDNGVTENRPLHLLVPSPGGERAEVKLDI